MSFAKILSTYAHEAGGSFKTRSNRITMALRFSDYLKNRMNIQVRNPAQIKVRHIEEYVALRLKEGISKRTLQNELAAIRTVLARAGRGEFLEHERLTNKALGVAGASRAGTKTAITQQQFDEAFNKAMSRDEGFAACLLLSLLLGLRDEEAVQSNKSLDTWLKHLQQGRLTLRVVFGTKGDRPRSVTIHPEMRQQVVEAVRFARQVAQSRDGKLIDKPDLKTAMNKYGYEAKLVGLTGMIAPHSLRYAFTRRQIDLYQTEGFSREEAIALTSMDLGHGDKRGFYVERVYTK